MGKVTDSDYKQCRLTMGSKRTTSWLPVQYAKKGKTLELRDNSGAWSGPWTVESAGTSTIDGETAMAMSRAWTKHRDFSDI